MSGKLAFVVSALLVLSWVSAPVQGGLVAYYPFDGSADDTSGVGTPANGTLVGNPTFAEGPAGFSQAIKLDGSTQYVNCGNPTKLQITGTKITVMCWVKMESALAIPASGYGILFAKGSNAYRMYKYPSTNGNGHKVLWSPASGANYAYNGTAGTSVDDGNWHHIAGTYDGANIVLYIDGVQDATTAWVGTVATNTTDLWIGNTSAATGRNWKGSIDDVRIYDTAATLDEVKQVMEGAFARPFNSRSPKPADKATDIARDTVLGWDGGKDAVSHDVYFGTNADSLPRVAAAQAGTTYDPAGILDFGTTYYWRIDEISSSGSVTTGDLWSFTTEPEFYAVTGVKASASSSTAGSEPNATIDGSGLNALDEHGTEPNTMWATAKGTALPAWILYDLGRVRKLESMLVWNSNRLFEDALGIGAKDVKVEYSTDATNWTELTGVPAFEDGLGDVGYTANTTVNFGGVTAQFVKLTINSTWGSAQTGLSEVRFMEMIDYARTPQPVSGAVDVKPNVTLGWRAGREAVSHQVFIGTDPNALTLADTTTATSSAPANLAIATKYYWRVDEVNPALTPTTWAGDVWNFTTPASIVLDDMESYTGDAGKAIFEFWIGNGDAASGGYVGLDNTPFVETTLRHGGAKSMPFRYRNVGGVTNSEATLKFVPAQDWTRYGVQTLTLSFYGLADNPTALPLYIKLTDQNGGNAKVVYGAAGESLDALAEPAWTTWNIPLAGFKGMALSAVQSITIGMGPGSGSGQLYFDDIVLNPTVSATPAATPTLVGWWKMENNVKDSTTFANDGTVKGTPTYAAAGKFGASIKLNGTTDYVDCGNGPSLNMTDAVTVAAWIKGNTLGNSVYQTFIGKGDHAYVLQQVVTSNYIQLAIYDGTWYQCNSPAVTSAMNGTWHHVAGTYDGTQIKTYIDGKLVASLVHQGVIATNTFALTIGTNSEYTTARLFSGEMDDVRVYHGVLPTADIAKLVNP